jgi:hypothetical protein
MTFCLVICSKDDGVGLRESLSTSEHAGIRQQRQDAQLRPLSLVHIVELAQNDDQQAETWDECGEIVEALT